jgi:hypothetical protein
MSKRTNKVQQTQSKVKNDGKAIADLEKAVHKAKERNTAARAPKSRIKQKQLDKEIIGLLGSKEEQEVAWLEALLDPEAFAARIPITQVTGAVPVNLYRKSVFHWAQGNANGFACAATFAEGWNNVAGYVNQYMRANASAASSVGTYTGATYVGSSLPAAASALPTGASAMSLGDVDADFVDNANDGTEYIMVGLKLSVNSFSTSGGLADEHYVGRVAVVRTLDPERYTLAGQNLSALKALADEEDSSIQIVEYLINPSGTFTPVMGDGEVLGEISATIIPVTKDAYEWRRIDASKTTSTANTSPFFDLAVIFEGVASAKFEIRWTGLWQMERYPTHLVTSANSVSDYGTHAYPPRPLNGTSQDIQGYHFISPWNNKSANSRRGRMPAQLLRVQDHIATARPIVTHTNNGSSGSVEVRDRVRKARRLKGIYVGYFADVPRSVTKTLGHTGRTLGRPTHPGVAPLAVLASAADEPGFWNQMANAGIPALQSILCDKKLAKIAASAGPAAVDAAEDAGAFSLSGLLSGAWEVAKTVGPAILGLLM